MKFESIKNNPSNKLNKSNKINYWIDLLFHREMTEKHIINVCVTLTSLLLYLLVFYYYGTWEFEITDIEEKKTFIMIKRIICILIVILGISGLFYFEMEMLNIILHIFLVAYFLYAFIYVILLFSVAQTDYVVLVNGLFDIRINKIRTYEQALPLSYEVVRLVEAQYPLNWTAYGPLFWQKHGYSSMDDVAKLIQEKGYDHALQKLSSEASNFSNIIKEYEARKIEEAKIPSKSSLQILNEELNKHIDLKKYVFMGKILLVVTTTGVVILVVLDYLTRPRI